MNTIYTCAYVLTSSVKLTLLYGYLFHLKYSDYIRNETRVDAYHSIKPFAEPLALEVHLAETLAEYLVEPLVEPLAEPLALEEHLAEPLAEYLVEHLA